MSFEQCQRITSFLSGFNKPWFFAGGWAIDLFIGRETRPHLVDLLEDERKKWLRNAIQLHQPEHIWLRFLTDYGQSNKKPS